MQGTIIYANTGITSLDGEISIGHHTNEIHVMNMSSATDATIKLNGKYQVLVPHTPNQSVGIYTEIPGDYTKIEVLTADTTISIFAIG